MAISRLHYLRNSTGNNALSDCLPDSRPIIIGSQPLNGQPHGNAASPHQLTRFNKPTASEASDAGSDTDADADINTETRARKTRLSRFSLPSVGAALLPCIGEGTDKRLMRSSRRIEHRAIEELIQSTEFFDLFDPYMRKNALLGIGRAIARAQEQCASLQPRLSAHVAGKVLKILAPQHDASMIQSSFERDCEHCLSDRHFRQSLEEACGTREGFTKAVRSAFRKRMLRAHYHEVFTNLQVLENACVNDQTRRKFLKRTWKDAMETVVAPDRWAMIEYLSLSLSRMPPSYGRLKAALYMQMHLPNLADDVRHGITRHLEPCLEETCSDAKTLGKIAEVPAAPAEPATIATFSRTLPSAAIATYSHSPALTASRPPAP